MNAQGGLVGHLNLMARGAWMFLSIMIVKSKGNYLVK